MSKRLLKFKKPGCSPCVMVNNYLNDKGIETEELDVFESPEAAQFGISSVPTLILVEDGEIIDRVVGFNPDAIDELLSQY